MSVYFACSIYSTDRWPLSIPGQVMLFWRHNVEKLPWIYFRSYSSTFLSFSISISRSYTECPYSSVEPDLISQVEVQLFDLICQFKSLYSALWCVLDMDWNICCWYTCIYYCIADVHFIYVLNHNTHLLKYIF